MTTRKLILAALAFGFSAATLAAPTQEVVPFDAIQPGQSVICKINGDGTFQEIVTTMASVLPADKAASLLNKYMGPCMKQVVSLNQR